MVPSSVAQVAIFLLLACPGLIWVIIRERRLPRWTRSIFRETAEIITASAVADIAGFTISLWVWESHSSLRSRDLLADFALYYRTEPILTLGWLTVGFGIATILAATVAIISMYTFQSRKPLRNNFPVWHSVFAKNKHKHAGNRSGLVTTGTTPSYLIVCELDDGAQVSGLCSIFDDTPGNEGKRDMVLMAPTIRYPDPLARSHAVNLVNYSSVVVNEQHIRWWTTRLLDAKTTENYIKSVLGKRQKAATQRYLAQRDHHQRIDEAGPT